MGSSFDEFESTDLSKPVVQTPKPPAPQIPTPKQKVTTPPPGRVEYIPPEPFNWDVLRKGALFVLQASFVLLIVAFILLAIFFGERFVREYQFAQAKPVVENPRGSQSSSGELRRLKTSKRVSKLTGQNNWLRTLLKRSRREARIAKENLATRDARINNLMNSKSEDEKYHEFLKYALDQFMSRPFIKGEGSRSICYTTDTRNQKCFQIVRPEGWRFGDPMPRLRQL